MQRGLQGRGLCLREFEDDAIQPAFFAEQGLGETDVGHQQPLHGDGAWLEGAGQGEGQRAGAFSVCAQHKGARLPRRPTESSCLGG
ncbi:hypothetical protein D3C75_980140 [compost metagenome]